MKFKFKKYAKYCGVAIIALYVIEGINLRVSQNEFCGKVNRFVVGRFGDETISIIPENAPSALGYRIKNVVYIPFTFSLGSQRRKQRLIVGQSYKFTSVGLRLAVFGRLPTIVKDAPVTQCAADTGPISNHSN